MLALAAAAALLLFGHSADHQPLRAERVGEGPVKVLVVGSIHGNETAGRAVISRLRRATPPAGVELWLVDTVNPDGVLRGTRQNARGVDLNRNFGRRWAGGGRAFDTYFPGRSAFSEPESRAVRRLVRLLHPAVTVWYHQHMRLVNLSDGVDRRVVRDYARRVGLPARQLPRYRGTATGWQNHTFPGSNAFVVELPAGHAVISRLHSSTPPAGVELWLVDTVNPDGMRRGTRQNARGVDLNRNFGRRWAGGGRAAEAAAGVGATARTALAWRRAEAALSGPAGSSTTNALVPGNVWFSQPVAVPW